jgi:hypothetical protein
MFGFMPTAFWVGMPGSVPTIELVNFVSHCECPVTEKMKMFVPNCKVRSFLKICLRGLVLFLAVTVVHGSSARAQQGKPVQGQVIRRVQVSAPAVSEQQFDAWVFRQDRTPEAARWRLDSLLELQIDEYDRACKLSAPQKQKLQLSGRGDIKRFFDRYETAKDRYRNLTGENQNVQEILQEANPLSAALQAGLFGETSLLRRSIPNVLTTEQLSHYESVVEEQMHSRHLATINLVVTSLEQAGKFPKAEREKFIEVMSRETKLRQKPGQYDFYYLLGQLGRLPEKKYKPLLTDAQLEMLEKYQTQFQRLEPLLRQAGYFADDDEDGKPAVKQRVLTK